MTALAYPDPQLTSGALTLREWRESDIPLISRTWSNPTFGPFITGAAATYPENEARDWFNALGDRLQAGNIELAVTLDASEDPVGAVSAQINSYWLRAEIGYWLTPAAEGNGYMTTAVDLLCRWLFDHLQIGRIELITSPANLPSQRVAQRVGFQREGLLRGYLFDRKTDQRRDSQIWGILRDDPRTHSRM